MREALSFHRRCPAGAPEVALGYLRNLTTFSASCADSCYCSPVLPRALFPSSAGQVSGCPSTRAALLLSRAGSAASIFISPTLKEEPVTGRAAVTPPDTADLIYGLIKRNVCHDSWCLKVENLIKIYILEEKANFTHSGCGCVMLTEVALGAVWIISLAALGKEAWDNLCLSGNPLDCEPLAPTKKTDVFLVKVTVVSFCFNITDRTIRLLQHLLLPVCFVVMLSVAVGNSNT